MFHRTDGIGMSGKKPRATKTVILLGKHKLAAATLWHGKCFHCILWVHSYLWKALTHSVMNPSLQIMLMLSVFPQVDGNFQNENALCPMVRHWFKSTKTLKYFPNSSDLNPSTPQSSCFFMNPMQMHYLWYPRSILRRFQVIYLLHKIGILDISWLS